MTDIGADRIAVHPNHSIWRGRNRETAQCGPEERCCRKVLTDTLAPWSNERVAKKQRYTAASEGA